MRRDCKTWAVVELPGFLARFSPAGPAGRRAGCLARAGPLGGAAAAGGQGAVPAGDAAAGAGGKHHCVSKPALPIMPRPAMC